MIRLLHTDAGILMNPEDIASEFCSYYKTLFNGSSTCSITHDIPTGPSITTTQSSALGVVITDAKILVALNDGEVQMQFRSPEFKRS